MLTIGYTINTNLKVLLANKYFFMKGGSERVFFQEREFLLNNGVKVIDFSMVDDRNFSSTYTNWFVTKIDYRKSVSIREKIITAAKFVNSWEAVKKLKELLRKENPQIAHLHNIYHQLTPAIIPVLKDHGVKVVLTLHDGKLICPNYLMLAGEEICTACKGYSFWRPLAKNCLGSRARELLLVLEAYWHKWAGSYDKVNLFLSPSRFLGDLVSNRIPREKIRVLHNGIDINKYKPSTIDHGYALFFGRLSREKGIESLLRAHDNIAGALTLKIVGTGPMEDHLRKSFRAVDFLGYREGEELKGIVSNASFVIVPSEWYENCSMVVLEAMAMGKAVIGSRIGGIPEQIDDGKTGFLSEMGNVNELTEKMMLLAKNSDVRTEMGREARKKVEREYSLGKHCENLLGIYHQVLSYS